MIKQKKIFVLAGEASGDVLGSEFIKYSKNKWPKAEFVFWGGKEMSDSLEGQKPQVDLNELSLMGFFEVARHIPRILKQEKKLKIFLSKWKPDLIICIDYQTFNIRLAKWATLSGLRKNGTKLIQIVSPQFWAWRPGRITGLKKYIDTVIPLLPFEAELLRKEGIDAPYFGHPAVQRVKKTNATKGGWLALLPGSRRQELSKHIPIFFRTAVKLKKTFKWVRPAHIGEQEYKKILIKYSGKSFNSDQIVIGVSALEGAEIALVSSGTATLETALRGIPQVVAYKTSWLTYLIAKFFIRVDHISLVNLILNDKIVNEFIQNDCNSLVLFPALEKLLNDNSKQTMSYEKLRHKLDLNQNPMSSVANYVANNL
jgi:lipid-A-disaccharide synthase|tara:strand:- start:14051 stop:15160 length:1110 start_codon:yes stop_codon:yes gene_type:complete